MQKSIIYAEGKMCQCVKPKNVILSETISCSFYVNKNGREGHIKVKLAYDYEDDIVFMVFSKKEKQVFAEMFAYPARIADALSTDQHDPDDPNQKEYGPLSTEERFKKVVNGLDIEIGCKSDEIGIDFKKGFETVIAFDENLLNDFFPFKNDWSAYDGIEGPPEDEKDYSVYDDDEKYGLHGNPDID